MTKKKHYHPVKELNNNVCFSDLKVSWGHIEMCLYRIWIRIYPTYRYVN